MRLPGWTRILGVLAALAVGGCDVPHPFQHDEDAATTIPQSKGGVLCIAPIPGLPDGLEKDLRGALADELVSREYLATAADGCPPPRLISWIGEETEPSAVVLAWNRPAPPNSPDATATVSLSVPADETVWPDAAKRWAKSLADRLSFPPPKRRSVRQPGDLFLDRPGIDPTNMDMTRVFVSAVTGASGDGNLMLRFAMIGHLRKMGYDPETEGSPSDTPAPYKVTARVRIDAPRQNETGDQVQRVRITWDVDKANGENLGSIDQANDVPKAALDRGWGAVADAASAAAAGTVADLMNQDRADAGDASAASLPRPR